MKNLCTVLLYLCVFSSLFAQPTNYTAVVANSITPGTYNVLVGPQAGTNITTGNYNSFLGYIAGYNTTTGFANCFIGQGAGFSLTTGSYNSFVGFQAGFYNTASANTFFGWRSGFYTTTGEANVFIGRQSGYSNVTGTGNMFLGNQAGYNSTGSYNLFMGNGAGQNTTSADGNTAIGDGSFYNNTTGTNNTAIGRFAGINLTAGSNNTFIGVAATNPSGIGGTINNSTAIGYNAIVTASNSMVLGNGVNVGIGTSAPTTRLEIVSSVPNTSGLRLTNLTQNTSVSLATTKYLTVDNNGNVVLGSTSGSGRLGSEDVLWQRTSKGFLQNSQNDAVIIGQGISTIPAGYKLFVGEGILTERIKVALKSSSEWSDFVLSPSYQLAPLSDVEQYISQKGHLPGVPSAQEMLEKGNDLHKTDAKLLEKIEELTLYTIKQQHEIEELKRLVDQLIKKEK